MTRRAWLAFAGVTVVWGIPYFLIKVALLEVSPVFLTWSRLLMGAMVLLPLAWRRGALPSLRGRWRWILAFAVTEMTVPFLLIPVGEQFISSSMTAIIIAAVPLIIGALSMRFARHDRPDRRRLAGMLVGLSGVVALVGLDLGSNRLALLGAACMLGAALGYAVGPMIAAGPLADLDPLAATGISAAIAAALLTPAGLALAPHRLPSPEVLLALLGLGVLCTAAGMSLYFILVTEAGASRASIITYVTPIIAVALGVVILGERLTPAMLAGMALILGGSWLATGNRLRR